MGLSLGLRQGRSADDVFEEMTRLLPGIAAREETAVTHGDWCLPNVLLDPATVTVVGLIDTARAGRADRYVDLGLMSRSLSSSRLNPQYGRVGVARFLRRCGHGPANEDKIAFYRLLDEFF